MTSGWLGTFTAVNDTRTSSSPWNCILRRDLRLNPSTALCLFREQHRGLLLGGLSPVTFQDLANSGASDLADPAIVCPDLELAIARAYLLISP